MSDSIATPSNSATPPPPAEQPATSISLTGGTVIIEVGPRHVKHCVPTAFLAYYSDYFAKALQEPCTDGKTGLIKLHGVEPAIFDVYMHWLYNDQQLPDFDDPSYTIDFDDVVDQTGTEEQRRFGWLVKAYIFADRFLITELRYTINAAIVEAVRGEMRCRIKMLDFVKIAFDKIPADRPLLQLLVNQFCQDWSRLGEEEYPLEILNDLSAAFRNRVIIRFGELRDMSSADEHDKACYLESHVTDEEKKDCGKLHAEYDERDEYARLR